MDEVINRFLGISSKAIVSQEPDLFQMAKFFQYWGSRGRELEHLINNRNGFWAFESSLLVRPFSNSTAPLGILEWNNKLLWKGNYDWKLDHVLCFAEDAFGCQFCLVEEKVCLFDPETGQLEDIANNLQDWAKAVIGDFEIRTGYSLAHAWQIRNLPLPPGARLLPKVPFVLGGKYSLENLHLSNDVEGMKFRAMVANQIRDVPDGGKIIIEIINKSS